MTTRLAIRSSRMGPGLVFSLFCAALVWPAVARGDGPADNVPQKVRPVPPQGIDVPAETKQKLQSQLAQLNQAIDVLVQRKDARTRELLPDVQIFARAVGDALKYGEFFNANDLKSAELLLQEGLRRAEQLAEGKAPWTTARGLVARGYLSKIDGSVQPYGVVVPESYSPQTAGRYRLDVWFHGRGETLSEANFLQQRRTQVGQFAPPDTIVLHPYGRYCNAFKFAGEVDVLEAIEAVRRSYRVDDARISVRGFSMGGAACWQFAVHYADRWFAANPGAGFAETPEFLRVFQKETLQPTWWERKLWHWYDCPDWAVNLHQCPTVAYSGEIDIQKQAADIMQQALARQGIELVHVIGPQTRHAYHPAAAKEVEQRMASLARVGRQPLPRHVQLATYTLRYNRMNWVTVDGLDQHWERATVDAQLSDEPLGMSISTGNVSALTLQMQPGECPWDVSRRINVRLDNESFQAPQPKSDRSWRAQFHRAAGQWKQGPAPETTQLRKRHALQGPIDDALMDSFLFVEPTGRAAHPAVEKWTTSEMKRAVKEWRRQMRGDVRIKKDTEVTDQDIASANLILWGDRQSNALVARVADRLPIGWDSESITVGTRKFPAAEHALIAIYPNPLNSTRYVVLNSSFTYREYAYLNNARQVPMLPDWAVVDLRTPPNTIWPGKIVAADFFGEQWQLRPPHEEPAR